MRFAFDGVEDLQKVTELTPEEIASSDFGTNTRDEYFDDLFRLTSFRTDPDLCELLVGRSQEGLEIGQVEVKTDIAIEIAITRIPRVSFVSAPQLPRRGEIASKYC